MTFRCVACGNEFEAIEIQGVELISVGCPHCGKEANRFAENESRNNSVPEKLNSEFKFASFGVRTLAMIIDEFICLGFCLVIILPLGFGGIFDNMNPDTIQIFGFSLIIVIYVFYYTYFCGKYSATLGKKMLGLKIVKASSGEKISYGLAFGRYLVSRISGIILFIGYIAAAFSKEKVTLHDSLCDTRVIKIR